MAFVWKADQRLKSPERVALELLEVAKARGLDEFAAVLAVMCVAQESDFWCPANEKDPASKNYPHDALSNDGRSVAYFQQQNGRAGDTLPAGDRDDWWGSMASRMDLKLSANVFYDRLEDNYRDAINNPLRAAQFIQNVQRSYWNGRADHPGYYGKHWDRAWQLVRNTNQPAPEVTVPDNRPFNEFPIWSANSSTRGGAKPTMFLLHTQEGGGGNSAAEDLAKWYQNANNVSYHYAVSQASDGGVTVVDCVDTDLKSWSVGDANPISINLVFAGSKASWSRDQWMAQANAIDAAAYLAVQDAAKYGFSTLVVPPPYSAGTPGISDHKWVTEVFGWGTHTDVGPNFPWDHMKARVEFWLAGGAVDEPEPETPAVKRFPDDWTDRELMLEILRQLRGPALKGWNQLGDRSVVDALAAVGEKLGVPGFDDRGVV